ncbi:ferritin-like protein [Saccharopolyspora sp. SCSIO 74807]|uniref:ferritin-like domain-containing protein n=1 Tax=Saccharopolyspora sp. SCSIO 74807 TaxID=3118084 RepID=UPI0030CB8B27
MTTGTDTGTPPYADSSISELLAVPTAERNDEWLRGALQAAVELEMSTIPPYLCALWSIKAPEDPSSAVAAETLRHIALDEMFHLAVVNNLLVAVGGRPRLRGRAPTYPGPLPRGIVPGLVVHLQGLTRGSVGDVFMGIERPEDPLARDYDTVGLFYEALIENFRHYTGTFRPENQREISFGGHALPIVHTTELAIDLLEQVKEEGEGTATNPLYGDELAHYYRFGELAHGRRLVRIGPGDEWAWAGAEVPFPEWQVDVYPMAQLPGGGWPEPLPEEVQRPLRAFGRTYAEVLDQLEQAWSGNEQALPDAIAAMRRLQQPAQELMHQPYRGGSYTYGPDFRPVS